MARGRKAEVGEERISQNGYQYVKTGEKTWTLKHHLIAEEKLGRPLEPGEGAYFIDNDRTNFDPKNIGIRTKGKASLNNRLAELYKRRSEIDEEIKKLEAKKDLRENL